MYFLVLPLGLYVNCTLYTLYYMLLLPVSWYGTSNKPVFPELFHTKTSIFVGGIINKYCIYSFMLHRVKDTYSEILANYPALYWLLDFTGASHRLFIFFSRILLQTYLFNYILNDTFFLITYQLWDFIRKFKNVFVSILDFLWNP